MALTITIPGAVEATIGATAPAILTVGVGVPGATGAQGPQGDPGEGVPVGGSAGQVLAKIDGTNYNTEWVNVEGDYLPLAGGSMDNDAQISFTATAGGGALLSASSLLLEGGDDITTITPGKVELAFEDVPLPFTIDVNGMTFPDATVQTTAFTGSYLPLAGGTMTGDINFSDNVSKVVQSYDGSQGGTIPGDEYYSAYNLTSLSFRTQNYSSDGQGGVDPPTLINGSKLSGYGLSFVNFNDTTRASTMLYGPTSITFGNASVQTIAFPGFNNTALTGNPTAPTATFGDSDTSIATTAFVQAGLAGGTAIARNLEVQVRNQSGSTIPAGSIVYISGATGNLPLITLAQANNDADSAQTMGFTAAAIANNASGYVIVRGECQNLNTSALTEGVQLYLSPTVAGAYTTTKPAAPQHLVYVGIVIRAHPTLGTILVAVQNGYELEELHNVAAQTPANNDLLAYETSTDLWKNKTASTLGLAAINSQAFTGTPSLPTGTTGITQSPGNNTTALATTAFVTAAVPAFASTAEVVTATSTTTALAPGNQGFLLTNPRLQSLAFIANASVSGSGANATTTQTFCRQMYLATLSVGRSSYSFGAVGSTNAGFGTSTAKADQVDFSKKVWISGYAMMGHSGSPSYLGDANTMCRISLGGYSTNTTGNMTLKGIGLKKVGGVASTVSLTVHNGTSLTDVSSSVTVADGGGIHWQIYSDGIGNVTLYINGTQAATTAAGPTTATASGSACYREQIEAVAIPGVRQVMNCNGGWFYTE